MSEEQKTYQVFARKYRPRTFDDVLGQDHVVRTLKNAIEQDRLAHAYLFVGPRGTGKTSTARILAKALNCPGGPKVDYDPDDPVCREIAEGNSLDVLEIDGASNNGVEQVRELRETVQFAPSSGKFKIYYIDEVHMLTPQAFNALLKTLEEPPAHVKFIFATTEAQKILPTIISRCQRFDLRRIPAGIIASHLQHIAGEEGLTLEEAAAFAIAKGAEGGMRDAQSMLDQLVAFCGEKIAEQDVLDIFGFHSAEAIAEFAGLLLGRDNAGALAAVHRHSESGRDLTRLLTDLIAYCRNLLVEKVDPGAGGKDLPPEVRETLQSQVGGVPTDRLIKLIDLLAETDSRMKWSPNKKLHLEIAAIKAIQSLGESSLEDVIRMVSHAAEAAEDLPADTPAGKADADAEAAPVERGTGQKKSPEPSGGAVGTGKEPEVAAPDRAKGSHGNEGTGGQPDPSAAESSETDAPEASSLSGLSGEALWKAASEAAIKGRPVLAMWLEAAHFLRHEGGRFVIGFATEQRFYRESLAQHEDYLRTAVEKLAGTKLDFSIEVDDSLEPHAVPEEDSPGQGPSGEEMSDPGDRAEPVAGDAPAEDSPPDDEAPSREQSDADEDFHDDPLIKEAMEIFAAKVLPSN